MPNTKVARIVKRDFLATDRMIRWPDGRDVKFQIAIDITEHKKAAAVMYADLCTGPECARLKGFERDLEVYTIDKVV